TPAPRRPQTAWVAALLAWESPAALNPKFAPPAHPPYPMSPHLSAMQPPLSAFALPSSAHSVPPPLSRSFLPPRSLPCPAPSCSLLRRCFIVVPSNYLARIAELDHFRRWRS